MRLSRKTIVLLVIVALLGGAAVYLALNPDLSQRLINLTRSTDVVTEQDAIAQHAIAHAAPPYQDDYGLMRVTGYVQSMSKAELKTVKLEIQLYDEKQNKKELVKHIVTDVKPGQRKPYDVSAGSIGGSREAKISVVEVEVYK